MDSCGRSCAILCDLRIFLLWVIDLRLTHVVGLDKVAYDAWLPKQKKIVYTLKINYNFIFIWVVDHPKKKKKIWVH